MVLIIDDGNRADLTQLNNALSEIDEETRGLPLPQVEVPQKKVAAAQEPGAEDVDAPRQFFQLRIT